MRFITLEAARKNAVYSQKEVAEKICIHNQTVSKNDSSKIPFYLMEKLCDLYGVTKDEVFFGKKVRKK